MKTRISIMFMLIVITAVLLTSCKTAPAEPSSNNQAEFSSDTSVATEETSSDISESVSEAESVESEESVEEHQEPRSPLEGKMILVGSSYGQSFGFAVNAEQLEDLIAAYSDSNSNLAQLSEAYSDILGATFLYSDQEFTELDLGANCRIADFSELTIDESIQDIPDDDFELAGEFTCEYGTFEYYVLKHE